MSQAKRAPLPNAGSEHYFVLCGVCLAMIFGVQYQAGLSSYRQIDVLFGALFLVARIRLGPLLFVVLIAGVLDDPFLRGNEGLKLTDILLCAAVLGYVACHYRLQGIWYQLLPADARQRTGTPRRVFPWIFKRVPALEEKRSAQNITPQEIAWLVVTLPMWAVVAQLVIALLPQTWFPLGLPTPLLHILLVLWLLALGFLLARAWLGYWKHRSHDAATAQLYLQDLLWSETRLEQRRVNRWLVQNRSRNL